MNECNECDSDDVAVVIVVASDKKQVGDLTVWSYPHSPASNCDSSRVASMHRHQDCHQIIMQSDIHARVTALTPDL